MNKIWTLIKNDITVIKNRISKNNPKKIGSIIFIIIFFVAIITFSMSMQSIALLDIVYGTENEYLVIEAQLIMVFFISFMFSIMYSLSSTEKDTDFLLSLPITKKQIVAARIIQKYVIEVGIHLLIMFPTLIIYFIKTDSSFLLIVNGLLMILILPLFFVGFVFIFNAFINNVALRFKFYKIIRLFLMISAFILFMAGYMIYNLDSTGSPSSNKIINFFSVAITENNYFNLLIIFIGSLLVFFIGIYLFSYLYGKRAKTYKTKSAIVEYKSSKSIIRSIIKKEFKCYFTSNMYVFNTIIGYILILGGSIALFFINNLDENILANLVYLVACFSLSTCCISNSSVSLEGKNIWIYKSVPVSANKIMLGKVLANFILLFITLTVSVILMIISNRLEITTCILIYVLALANSVLISFGGYLANIIFPKLDFKNETEVVKASMSVGVSLFSFMILFSIPPFLLLFYSNFSILTMLGINIGVVILLDIICILLTFKINQKKFMEL